MAGNAADGQSEQAKPKRGTDMKDRSPERAQVRRLKLERGLLRAVTKLALAIATDVLTGERPAEQYLRRQPCKMHPGATLDSAVGYVTVLSCLMIAGRGPIYRAMSDTVWRKHGCGDSTMSRRGKAIGCMQAAQWLLGWQRKPQAT